MSNQVDPFENSLNIQTIQMIDQLQLSIMQKHHLRILAHCLALIKSLSSENNYSFDPENLLRDWCNEESRKFNDQKFSDLLYEQLVLTAKKLNNFSQKIGKNITDLDIEDLASLVSDN